jgi:hypothetical protein
LGNGHGAQGIKPHTAVVRPKVLVLIVLNRTGTKAVMVPKWDPRCRLGLAAGLSQRGHPGMLVSSDLEPMQTGKADRETT